MEYHGEEIKGLTMELKNCKHLACRAGREDPLSLRDQRWKLQI